MNLPTMTVKPMMNCPLCGDRNVGAHEPDWRAEEYGYLSSDEQMAPGTYALLAVSPDATVEAEPVDLCSVHDSRYRGLGECFVGSGQANYKTPCAFERVTVVREVPR